MNRRHVLMAPPLDGTISGGTLYNRQLVEALAQRGVRLQVVRCPSPESFRPHPNTVYWLDSLHLDALPSLSAHAPIHLLAHYLPSLVQRPDTLRDRQLSAEERQCLTHCRGVLATSAFMAERLQALGVRVPIWTVEPGLTGSARAAQRPDVAALVVGALSEGKGQLALLQALASQVSPTDHFRLDLVGGAHADPVYAAACRTAVARSALLSPRVRFVGELPRAQLDAELSSCNVLLSASRFESFGMAIAEARAAGLVLLVQRGGNAARHVHEAEGGRAVDGPAELARCLLELVRQPQQLWQRALKARSAPAGRTWSEAAEEFMAGPFGADSCRTANVQTTH